MSLHVANPTEIVYPESDGKPMADNTIQWDWMVKIVGELREQFAGQQVFVAGNLFWYPVEGQPRIVLAPDGLVAFGRPPGDRGSYKQWEEENVAPQVVFEVHSPNNTPEEMADKLAFYTRYGVEEYYYIDPYDHTMEVYTRRGDRLVRARKWEGFNSPRLGIRFELRDGELVILGPDGRVFVTREERVQEIRDEVERERQRADAARRKLKDERRKVDEAQRINDILAAKLRELGVNPDELQGPSR